MGFLWCTKIGKIDFVQGINLVHQFRTGILFQNPKINSLFHKHDHTKNRFPRLYSKNGMNVGFISVKRVADWPYSTFHRDVAMCINT